MIRKTNFRFPICFLRFVIFFDCEKKSLSSFEDEITNEVIVAFHFMKRRLKLKKLESAYLLNETKNET